MTRKSFAVSIALAALLFSGCETLSNYGFVNRIYLAIYKFSPQQKRAAETQVQKYGEAVKRGKRAPAKNRYIAVQTLDPNPQQLEAYSKEREAKKKVAEAQGKSLQPEWVEPNKLHCLMVFDTQSKEFVGSDCYAVAALPPSGQVAHFEGITAEFVGAAKTL
jgi:hypothetical protein